MSRVLLAAALAILLLSARTASAQVTLIDRPLTAVPTLDRLALALLALLLAAAASARLRQNRARRP